MDRDGIDMRKARLMMGSLLGAALVVGSAVPAEARPRYGHYHDRYRYHGRDGFGFGDAVGVAALVGAVAIVASSISKDRKAAAGDAPRDRALDDDAPPPADGTDYGADVEATNRNEGRDAGETSDALADADACANAARQEASAGGGYAEVRRMDDPRTFEGGYNIDGEIEARTDQNAANGSTRRFTCTVKDGRVANVYLSRDLVSR
ncbi:MAG: hypothetical protein QHC40_13480 [Sphingobium sp.]|nr:hypothetical protein [Sphingobium sp.]